MACGFGVVQQPAAACIAAGGRVAGRPHVYVHVGASFDAGHFT